MWRRGAHWAFLAGALLEARFGVVRKLGRLLLKLVTPSYEPLRPLLLNAALSHDEWLNLGLWEGPDRGEEFEAGFAAACRRLALRVARAAELCPGDAVYDAGFGRGDQLVLWAREFSVSRIVGANVDENEVAAARRRVAAAGLACGTDLRCADCARHAPGGAAVDAALAVDCAYHFDPLPGFLRRAHAALRPGGRVAFTFLALDDGLWAATPGPARPLLRLALRAAGVPAANVLTSGAVADAVARAGFADVEIEDLTAAVLGGFAAYVAWREARFPGLAAESGWAQARAAASAARLGERWPVVRYVLVSAAKRGPAGAARVVPPPSPADAERDRVTNPASRPQSPRA